MEVPEVPNTPKTHKELVTMFAKQYNVSERDMVAVIECETAGTWDTNIQSYVKYNFSSAKRGIIKGDRERSYGLSQIHLPDHPYITISEAKDATYSIEFMARAFSKGKQGWWSCYNNMYK